MRRPGLRTRVAGGFAAGALLLATTIAVLSYELTRGSLLTERERTATRTTYFDATVVQAGLASDDADVVEVLRSLDSGAARMPVLYRNGTWFARTADAGVTDAIPDALQRLVNSGTPAVQRVRIGSGPALIFGIPLGTSSAFYEIHSLAELERTLQVLALILALVAAGTTFAGAGLGWYATRYVLRPLTTVADAARGIAAGDLNARLDAARDPELERLTTSFNHMVDQLSKRLERDRRFAADVSHELRSPLQTLAAAASVLDRRREHLDPRTATAAGLLVAEVNRFSSLVADLLELARSDQPLETSPVDVAGLARQVCRARGLDEALVTVGENTNPNWYIDRRRFERVLGNLIDNAIRHGGGPVAIGLGDAPGIHYVEVDDEGPGIPSQDRDTIFDRFVRGRGANARGDSDGTGLGLALVDQHVTAHSGRVLVTDRPGGGARFRVEVPEHP
jgi:two-component system, OmpR family, sensor histidine kinase MtrB